MKFTDADFASAITPTTYRPKPPLRIDSPYSNLRLPVAPPSPLFDGIDEDIGTNQFPAFENPLDMHENVPAPAPHCTLHCDHRVCMGLTESGLDPTTCQCESEEREPTEGEQTTSWYRPEMDLDYLVISSIDDSIANTDPLHEIEIHYTEVVKILAHLEDRAKSLAPYNEHLSYAMRCDYAEYAENATGNAVHHIFRIMRLYFHRTLRFQDDRSMSIQQLRRELEVYLWMLLVEWVETYCDDETCDRVLAHRGPVCVTKATSGSSAAVLGFWKGCIEDVLELLVWRDEEVRWCKVDSGMVFCFSTVLVMWVLATIF